MRNFEGPGYNLFKLISKQVCNFPRLRQQKKKPHKSEKQIDVQNVAVVSRAGVEGKSSSEDTYSGKKQGFTLPVLSLIPCHPPWRSFKSFGIPEGQEGSAIM